MTIYGSDRYCFRLDELLAEEGNLQRWLTVPTRGL